MNLFPSLALTLCLSNLLPAQQAPNPIAPTPDSATPIEVGTAKIEQVFKAEDDGFQFIAYQITYHGKRVIVDDPIGSTNFRAGDEVRFIVCRNDMTKSSPKGKKLMAFIVHLAQS